MTIKSTRRRYQGGPRRQRGVIATLLAIIVLVATLLAAVALMRSIDTSNTIAGSLAFRQNVIQEAERAFVDARTLLNGFTLVTTSQADIPGVGYYASLQSPAANRGIPTLLITQSTSAATVSGVKALAVATSAGSTGNAVYYVLERLCPSAGPASTTTCVVPGATNTAGSLANQGSGIVAPSPAAAYRLTVLVKGQKNTLGYVQTTLL